MGVVAVRADRDRQKPLFDQAWPWTLLGIVHQDVPLGILGRVGGGEPAVAFAAELGDVRPVGLVGLVLVGPDLVLAVAVGAVRRFGLLLEIGLAVVALEILLGDLGVAARAVHSADGLAGAGPPGIDVRVALHAGDVAVDGSLEVLLDDRQGNGLAVHDLVDIGFLVALQAFAVGRAHHQVRLAHVWDGGNRSKPGWRPALAPRARPG